MQISISAGILPVFFAQKNTEAGLPSRFRFLYGLNCFWPGKGDKSQNSQLQKMGRQSKRRIEADAKPENRTVRNHSYW